MNIRLQTFIISAVILFSGIFGLAKSSLAAPVISSASGNFVHGQSITVSGSGFGIKTQAAPIVWDDASGTNILDKWSGGWPNLSGAQYDLNYRTPAQVGRGVNLPHSHISKYLTGVHYPYTGYDSGYNVIIFKNRTISSYPAYSYMSWYQMVDPNWAYTNCMDFDAHDDNFKVWDYSYGNSPYTMNTPTQSNWYIEYNPRPCNLTAVPGWHINDDGASLTGTGDWGGGAVVPYGNWVKVEVEIRYDNTSSGYIRVWENGVQKLNYSGTTDLMSGTARSEGIGGFARSRGLNNWRYFADLYVDYSRSRIIIGNNSTFASSTVREAQIPSVWNDGSIVFTVNQATFNNSAPAYLYVVDSTGAANANGYPITFGSGSVPDTIPPAAPTGLSVS